MEDEERDELKGWFNDRDKLDDDDDDDDKEKEKVDRKRRANTRLEWPLNERDGTNNA